MTRRRKVLLYALGSIALLYATACVVASLAYRVLLYPAPRGPTGARPSDARALEATTSDGITAKGWLFSGGSDRPLVVHFHGNGETIADDVVDARSLVARGVDVLLAEYRGYGDSAGQKGPTEQGLYADAEALLDAAGVPPQKVLLWGTSLGTGVATEMAKRGKGQSLVLLAPFTSIPDIGVRVTPFMPVRLAVTDRFDSRSKAAAITMPVLIIHGTADEVVPYDMGQTLSHTFPRAELMTFPGGHHSDLFVDHADEIYDAIAKRALGE
jgi:uncharacterized protein